jgi:hypothetical protein
MSIKIERVAGGYIATVTPSPKLPESWSTDHPMPASALRERLIELGYHIQDIVDALYFADADRMRREG